MSERAQREEAILGAAAREAWEQTDRMFVWLMALQWIGGLAAAFWIAPRTWAGGESGVMPHIWAAVFLGGLITALPILLACFRPGETSTRMVIGAGQVLMSALLIHLTGGRIETHFHIFGSLAFLAVYRDWRVLALATGIVALDHLLRGIYWPESVFGVVVAGQWRWLEHTGWVLFEDAFLLLAQRQSERERRQAARRQAELELLNAKFEREVGDRTVALRRSEAAALNMMEDAQLAARKARDSEARFRAIIEAAPSAMIMVDSAGRITLVNSQAEDLFGYRRDELLRQPIEVLVPARFRGGHGGHRQGFMQDPRSRAMGAGRDLYGLRKDGVEVPIEIGLNPVATSEGRRVLASIIDITSRKRAEEVVLSKNRELESLLYVISHDLREPLRTIQSFSGIVLTDHGERLDAEGQHLLQRIVTAGERLERLLLDLLEVSRARRIEMTIAVTPGRELVDAAWDRVADREARIQVADNLPDLRVDPTWGTEAIYNLLANAVKYTHPGEHPDIEVTGWDRDGESGIVVADRGPGVPAEQAERIFELFQRGVGREVAGTGAGLAIVREVAQRHGGRAWVEARADGGARFVVTFGRRVKQDVDAHECGI